VRILADQHIHHLKQLVPPHVELVYYDSSKHLPRLDGFDAWILRTVTKVNPKTVPILPKKLKFIGSASSGTDHIDKEYLNDLGIRFNHSPGCNANAVAEYALTSMLTWCSLMHRELTDYKVGIVGMGHTGGALAKKLEAIGVPYAGYDPPKALREKSFRSCNLDTLNECPILSFHLPYTSQGSECTHYFMPDILSLSPKHKLIINAARGGLINEDYLLNSINLYSSSNKKIDVVIDVWETEPVPNKELVDKAFIATPHIAGYSKKAKLEASKRVLKRLLTYFDLKSENSAWQVDSINLENSITHKTDLNEVKLNSNKLSINILHGLYKYDNEMRKLINKYTHGYESKQHNTVIGEGFQSIRNTVSLREEFEYLTFPEGYPESLRPLFKQN